MEMVSVQLVMEVARVVKPVTEQENFVPDVEAKGCAGPVQVVKHV
jgi:hypothetical protein